MAIPLIWKALYGDELYVFFAGTLIYKKWLKTGADRVFHEQEGIHEKLLQRVQYRKIEYPPTLDIRANREGYVAIRPPVIKRVFSSIDRQPEE